MKRTSVTLKDTLYAPMMAFMLISTNRIASAGLAVLFEGKMCKILSHGPKRQVIGEIPQVEGVEPTAPQDGTRQADRNC